MKEKIHVPDIDNVIDKLNLIMQREHLTMHGLAIKMAFEYQPFYRLMTQKCVPNLSSLQAVAKNLNCSTAELLAIDNFIDIPAYNNMNDFITNKGESSIRIYLKSAEIDHNNFFAIKVQNDNVPNYQINDHDFGVKQRLYQLYIISNTCNTDGFFLVHYNNELINLNVISVSSTTIFAYKNKKKLNIPVEQLTIYGRFFKFIELQNDNSIITAGK